MKSEYDIIMELQEEYTDTTFFVNPGYISALVGISNSDKAVYDMEKMIEYLIQQDDMTYEEAVEWIEYNTLRAIPYADNPPVVITNHVDLSEYQ